MTRFTSPFPPIDVDACRQCYATLLFATDVGLPSDMPAYIDGITGEVITRAEHRRRCFSFAAAFRNLEQVGMKELSRGSTVLVFSPNSVLYPVIMLALPMAGVKAAYANTSFKPYELSHAFKISGATHMLVHPSLLPVALETLQNQGINKHDAKKIVILMDQKRYIPFDLTIDGWISLEQLTPKEGLSLPERFDGPKADETAVIYFSSGTTGLNKAVALTHLNIGVNVVQMAAAWKYYARGDIILGVLPFYHIYGGNTVVLLSWYLGAPIVILPKFDPERCLAAIQQYRITTAVVVPPLLTFFATDPRVDNYDMSSLRLITTGAAPVIPAMYDRCAERFKKRGISMQFGSAYGLTEITGLISWLPSDRVSELRNGSVGGLLSNTDGRLVDDDGNDAPPGEPGELWLRGPSLMKGYVGNSEATAHTITPDGWLITGDIATVSPEGFITVVDRRKELIKYKGFQVAPAELESILSDYPGIADSAVLGVFKDGTELPRAFIVPKNVDLVRTGDSDAFARELNEWLSQRVAHYKLLRGGVRFVDSVPRSAAGKIIRRELRQMVANESRAKL